MSVVKRSGADGWVAKSSSAFSSTLILISVVYARLIITIITIIPISIITNIITIIITIPGIIRRQADP